MERVLGISRHLVEVAWAFLVLCRCVDHVNPRLLSSVEVLLSVAVESTICTWCISMHSALWGHTEIRVLLTIEALVVLMSMEASEVASKLGVVMHAVVKCSEFVLLV